MAVIRNGKPGMVSQAFKPQHSGGKAGGSGVCGQAELSATLSQKQKGRERRGGKWRDKGVK